MSSTVFVSYLRSDRAKVDRLAEVLRAEGVDVWLDRTHLRPGMRWREEIRRQVSEGTGFVACFSKAYSSRDRSYMNEELTLAIDELRTRSADRSWFFPVRLDDCAVPDRSISQVESLRDIQAVDAFPDVRPAALAIARALRTPGPS